MLGDGMLSLLEGWSCWFKVLGVDKDPMACIIIIYLHTAIKYRTSVISCLLHLKIFIATEIAAFNSTY